MRFQRDFLFRVVVVLLFTLVASCGNLPDLVGADNAAKPANSVETTKRKIFIATTREASDSTEVFYNSERALELGLASVVVSIPPNHVAGQIERPKRLPPNPETQFAVIEPTVYGSDNSFVSALNRELSKRAPKDRTVMLFVHGYNTSASDGILRIAQFSEDTGFTGVPVLFSWASAAKYTHYVYDLNSVLSARPRLLEAAAILQKSKANSYDLFAHSMGGLLTVEAIVQAKLAGHYNTAGRLENVMLASPDIDLDVFRSQLEMLDRKDRNFTVFASSDDKALRLSRWISGGVPRVGAADAKALEELGVTVIDLSQIEETSSTNHTKFAGSPEVVQVIGNSLKKNNYNEGQNSPMLLEILAQGTVLTVLD